VVWADQADSVDRADAVDAAASVDATAYPARLDSSNLSFALMHGTVVRDRLRAGTRLVARRRMIEDGFGNYAPAPSISPDQTKEPVVQRTVRPACG
jgi:hypothetical protein